jgi:hypothetical protein
MAMVASTLFLERNAAGNASPKKTVTPTSLCITQMKSVTQSSSLPEIEQMLLG